MESVMQLFDLSRKVAVVTGGGMGIGQAICERLAEAGASVLVADINEEAAGRTAGAIEGAGGRAQALKADVREARDAVRTIQDALERFGGIDILVNNVGIYPLMPIMAITEELWDRVLDINLKGTFLYSQAAADAMIKSGRGGKIINLASIDALKPNGSVCHYNASKGGVLMLTKAFALEMAPHRILVNAVAPGAVLTPGTESVRRGASEAMGIPEEAMVEGYTSRVPLGRMGEPDDVARVVLFLASAAADYITGELIVVDGGYLLS